MERSTRNFAGWVLFIHVVMFLLLVAIVAFASREFYYNARTRAYDQLRVRQEMIATQAGRGIEGFYRDILDDLQLTSRAKLDVPRKAMAKLTWEQLRGRATRFLHINDKLAVLADQGDDQTDPQQLLERFRDAILKTRSPAIATGSGTLQNVLAIVPVEGEGRQWLIAVVPIRGIESRFLNDLSLPENVTSYLIDGGKIFAAESRDVVGQSYAVDPAVGLMMTTEESKGVRVSREVRKVGPSKTDAAMVTLQPIDLPGNSRWWLAVSSNLLETDQAVGAFLRRSIIGAVFVILAMTAVLVSTSIQTIRGRLRLERLQHEMIDRELASARDIQLAWLPDGQETETKLAIDIAAMNKPASHVSGDFYNWFELPDGRAVVVIGDVTGHGLPAAFLMATTQLLLRVTIDPRGEPGDALRIVNRQLCKHSFSGQFVTMLVMVLDPKTNVIHIANAGHPPPLTCTGDAFTPLDLKPDLVLGIDETVQYNTQRFELAPGASVLLYTDGITDLQAPSGDRFGIEGLAKSLFGRFDTASSLVEAAADAVESFRAGREADDDLTLVAVQLARAEAKIESKPEPAEPARTA